MDLILTGRAVKGKEAFEIGLANWIVACGTSLGQAIQYANSIAKFPQECLNRDRLSAYNAVYDAKDFESALQFEMKNGLDVISSESVVGAGTFVSGVGRHGSFNLHGTGAKNDKSKL
jgi:enoyl-CoA hydratase/carnithine racemase